MDPEAIAFGTVASVAQAVGTSTPSVVRLATALGYEGFAALRGAARAELSVRLNTDAVRARATPAGDPVRALLDAEHRNLDATLGGLDPGVVTAVGDLLDDGGRHLWVLPNTMTAGVAQRFVDQVAIIRGGVTLLDGSELRVRSTLGGLRRGDVLLSMDVPRHELATVRVQAAAIERGAVPVVLSGSVPVALSSEGGHLIRFACEAVGPFESLVGLTALATLLVNELVSRRRDVAADRLAALERTWTTAGLLDA